MLLPNSVYGKYVTGVGRGQEITETRRIPMMMAPLTRYIMSKTVSIPPLKIDRRAGLTSNGTNTGIASEAYYGKIQADSNSSSKFNGCWNSSGYPLTDPKECKCHENKAFDIYSCQCDFMDTGPEPWHPTTV